MHNGSLTPLGALDDFSTLDAIDQAELVRRGDVSPREMVEAAIRRIERVNPELNAVIECQFEKALRRADCKSLQAL